MTTLNNTLQLLQLQIAHSQSSTFGAFAAAPHHPGIPTLPAPQVPALLVHNGLNKNDLHDPTVPVAVQVVLQPSMLETDNLALYLNDTPVQVNTINTEDMQSGIVTFLVSPSQFPQDGEVTLHYHHIVPPSTSFTVSESVGPFLVKQSVPGNPDPDPFTPYVNEHLTPPTGIPDMVPAGQALNVTIPRYVNIAEHDEIVLHWSNREITKTLTADEANNSSTPLTISVPADIIDSTPGIGLIVRYDIHDTVKNWSLYSLEARTDVIPPGALHAPTVRDANDYDELDMDELDGADVAVQIPVNGNLPVGTEGVLTWTGIPVIGPRLTYTASFKIERAATRITLYVPNDKAAALVGSAGTVFYEATINGVSTPSQRTSVQVIGQPVTLEKPTLTDVTGDTYNPALVSGSHQQVIVPAYSFMASGQSVTLHWRGFTASGSGLFTQVTKRLTSDTPQDLDFLIDKVFATGLGTNTTLKVYYEIEVEGTAYVSPALELTVVGVPSNLPKPTTEPVFPGGEVDPGVVGATVKVVVEPNSTLMAGDMLTIHWQGRSDASTSITNRPFPASGNLEVPIGKEPYINGNINGYVEVWYEATRNSQPVGSSQRLVLHVNEPAKLPWPLPTLIDATGGQANPWQPVKPSTQFDTNTATVKIIESRLQLHDIVVLIWRLPDQTDLTIPWLDVGTAGEAAIAIPADVLAKSLGKKVFVVYVVSRGGETVGSSEPTYFEIGALPASSLSELIIMEAASGGAGPEFNVSGLTADANLRIGRWPLITQGQPVWLSLAGTRQDGSAWSKQVMAATPTDAAWASQGVKTVGVTLAELKALKDGSSLTVTFKVALEGSQSEVGAVSFAPRVYTVKSRVVVLSLPPSVREADPLNNTLNLLKQIYSATVQIPPYEGLQNGDEVTMKWAGAGGAGTTQQTIPVTTGQPPTFTVNMGVVNANIGRSVVITYSVKVAGGSDAGAPISSPLNLFVQSSTPYGRCSFEPGFTTGVTSCTPNSSVIEFSNSLPNGILVTTDNAFPRATKINIQGGVCSSYIENSLAAHPAPGSQLFPTNVPGIAYRIIYNSTVDVIGGEITSRNPGVYTISYAWRIEFHKVGNVTSGTVGPALMFEWLFGANRLIVSHVRLRSSITFIVRQAGDEPRNSRRVSSDTELSSEWHNVAVQDEVLPVGLDMPGISTSHADNEDMDHDKH